MNSKKMLAVRIATVVVLVFSLGALDFGSAFAGTDGEIVAASPGQPPAHGATPLQQAMQSMLEQRSRAHLPVPQAVSYSYDLTGPATESELTGLAGHTVTVKGTTTVRFEHPRQAGLERWPSFAIDDAVPEAATGFIVPGDYSAAVREAVANAIPGVWDRYAFGYEPRTYIFEETISVVYPGQERAAGPSLASTQQPGSASDLVMGFSTSGPRINYVIEESFCPFIICVASVKAGFALDWDIGFRLPITVELLGPGLVSAGERPFSVAIAGRDWAAEQYQAVGLEPVGGNEFVLQYVFFLGAKATIAGIDVVNAAWEASYDGSRSFTTPVGAGASFPIPAVDLPPDATGLGWSFSNILSLGIGLTMTPDLRAGGVSADWQATGDAAGNGTLLYNETGSPAWFASVSTGDFSPATSYATIGLTTLRYRFGQFSLKLGGYMQFELFGYGGKLGSFDIADFDLTPLTGGLWLNPHAGTTSSYAASWWVAGYALGLPYVRR